MTKKENLLQIDMTTPMLNAKGLSESAIFLPAMSSFYTAMLGKIKEDPTFMNPNRVPQGFENGFLGLEFQDPDNAYFYYKWMLYSAGHANIDVTKADSKENMIRFRDRKTSFVLGDSGGFQIGKTVWEGDWTNPNCPKAQQKREQVLSWLDAYMDYGMILDIPVWSCANPKAKEKIGISDYADAVKATKINNDYFIANRTGACKLLNVLQGETYEEAEDWYQTMKGYCDPKQYPENHFNGWSLGGQSVTDSELILTRLISIIHDGLLQEGKHDWVHFLGLGKIPWACFLTDVQKAIRKYHNPSVTLSFDAASPFLTTANGGVYVSTTIKDRGRWAVNTDSAVDDKKYSTDTRPYGEVLMEGMGYPKFEESPVSVRLMGKDICCYKPGDLNKIGKEGKTSWDSLSYCLLMGHNVAAHIKAIQDGLAAYASGLFPKAIIEEQFERVTFAEVIEQIFAAKTKQEALDIIIHYRKMWMKLSGSRGQKGTKTINPITNYNKLFSAVEEPTESNTEDEDSKFEDEEQLDILEHLIEDPNFKENENGKNS